MNEKNQKICENSQHVQNSDQVGDYLVGLDIGTDSIGWAVTDTEYNLLKARRRDLWGSYLFDPAETAEKRRAFRTARRRTARVRERLNLLQSLFKDEIEKVDGTFFIRLNDSKFYAEDKDERITTKYILFGDAGYNDKDYFKKYPTIFHLRNALMTAPPTDIRLLYLACHHIIKNRGHFLFEGQDFKVNDRDIVRTALGKVNDFLTPDGEEEQDESCAFALEETDKVADVLADAKKTGTDKLKELSSLLGVGKDKRLKECVKAIVGQNFDLKIIFDFGDDVESQKYNMAAYDDKRGEIESAVGEGIELLDDLKSLYDYGKLSAMLGESKYISEARVKSYETHKADLLILKAYIRANCPEKYKTVFRYNSNFKNNYAAYIGMDKHKSFATNNTKTADFCAFIRKQVCSAEELKAFIELKIEREKPSAIEKLWRGAADRLENNEFCPKQITSDNGVIPYQLHLAELSRILETAQSAYPFLLQTDEKGLTVKQRIEMLVKMRIPYFVGPTNGGKYAWAVRKEGAENIKVTPWNIEDVIDFDASENEFIARMTSKCSYLPGEDVLPKNSLLYKEAIFLNELNNLRVNGAKSIAARNLVLQYAQNNKSISKSAIARLLIKEGVYLEDGINSIGGIDDKMANSLSSYIDFKKIMGDKADAHREMCENIIKWITLFSDKNRLEKRIRKEYGDILSDEEIKRLKGLNYSGWGRLSEKLLNGITSDRVTSDGVEHTVIETLRLDSLDVESGKSEYINLTEALTGKRWGFCKVIEDCNDYSGKVTEKLIDEQYVSPSVKRAIRRTVDLVKEIVKIQGKPPKKICVEVPRYDDNKKKGKKPPSRKEKIIELYKKIQSDIREWNKDIVMPEGVDDRKFISDKVLLYYMQMGKCMYTGEPIPFEALFDTNVYDIDHIYPRSKINDDSLDNRVLVNKKENARKTDVYPVNVEIRNKMSGFWKALKDKGLISESKYKRLVRTSPITLEEQADFENRQIVFTGQSCKAVASILKVLLPETEIVYSKARKASDFKNKFGLVKVRELNDLHHAKDAYVNIIVGNTLNERYGHDARVYYIDNFKAYSDFRIFEHKVESAWDPEWKERITNIYNSNRVSVVRFVSEGHGELFNATIKTAGANDSLIPLKENGKISNTDKYGGYDSASTAYFALVESKGKKGKTQRSLEAISILTDLKAKRSSVGQIKYLTDYLQNSVGLTEPKIIIPKIRLNALLSVNGTRAYLRGKTENRVVLCNANEIWLCSCGAEIVKDDPEEYSKRLVGNSAEYLKKVATFNKKYLEQKRFKNELTCSEEFDKIFEEKNVELYDALVAKLGSGIFSGLPMANQAEALENKREKFIALSPEIQCTVIMKIIAFLGCNSVSLDLSEFGEKEAKRAGENKINKFIDDKQVRLIYQSPTGYYTREINLNTCKADK